MVNLGCLFALDANPAAQAIETVKNLSIKRWSEYGANHSVYRSLVDAVAVKDTEEDDDPLARQLAKLIDVLDLTTWQLSKLRELGLETVGSVLDATEDQLKEAKWIGNVRARRMRNAAVASVLEYLSG